MSIITYNIYNSTDHGHPGRLRSDRSTKAGNVLLNKGFSVQDNYISQTGLLDSKYSMFKLKPFVGIFFPAA